MTALRTLVFDFDGTLVRTREASWDLFRETNERFSLGVDSPSAFFGLFSGNFYEQLDGVVSRTIGPASCAAVREHFQELLRTRYAPSLIPGMASTLRTLAGHYTLVVVSSNAMLAVRRTLLAGGVAECFAHVFSGDVYPAKVDAIHQLLADPTTTCGRRCSPHYDESTAPRAHDAREVMLVSDTTGDVEEALASGIRAGAVGWGMHAAADLERAGAEFVCVWPEELVAYLRPGAVCGIGPCSLPAVGDPVEERLRSPWSPPPSRDRTAPPATLVSSAEARRTRRLEAAARVAARLAAAPAGPTCSCGVTTEPQAPADSKQPTPSSPTDPTLREVMALLLRPFSGAAV
jgi:phosphoglycolate phosphatase